jgi:hypothetical protein
LREKFGDVAGWSEATFYFASHPTTFASEFTQILTTREPYCILRLEYRGAALFSAQSSAGWCFTIYPVRRELKNAARGALATNAFDVVRSLMMLARTHSHYYNRVDAIFDPQAGLCTTERLYEV